MKCGCVTNETVDIIGLCDPTKIDFAQCDQVVVNSTEISIPEILTIPFAKPCIESIDKVFIDVKILSKRLVKTPVALDGNGYLVANEEATFLTGAKLVVEGVLLQKVVYTGDVAVQSVHSAHFEIPFSTFIMLPRGTDVEKDRFCVETCVEDVFVKQIGKKQIFKNVTLFLRAVLLHSCKVEKTATPVITATTVVIGSPVVRGIAVAGTLVSLCLNGVQQGAVTATGGDWGFNVPQLKSGDVIRVTAKEEGKQISAAATVTVPTEIPVMTGGYNAGNTVVSGIATAGAVIRLSLNGVPQTPVIAVGAVWSVPVPALALGNVISVTAQEAGKPVSVATTYTVV